MLGNQHPQKSSIKQDRPIKNNIRTLNIIVVGSHDPQIIPPQKQHLHVSQQHILGIKKHTHMKQGVYIKLYICKYIYILFFSGQP